MWVAVSPYMITVRFMTLKGPFKAIRTETFVSFEQANAAVVAHAAAGGYSNVKLACDNEDDLDEYRFTATSTGGRRGRNVAFGVEDLHDDSCL